MRGIFDRGQRPVAVVMGEAWIYATSLAGKVRLRSVSVRAAHWLVRSVRAAAHWLVRSVRAAHWLVRRGAHWLVRSVRGAHWLVRSVRAAHWLVRFDRGQRPVAVVMGEARIYARALAGKVLFGDRIGW